MSEYPENYIPCEKWDYLLVSSPLFCSVFVSIALAFNGFGEAAGGVFVIGVILSYLFGTGISCGEVIEE